MTLNPQTWHQTIRTFGVIEAAEKVIISAEFSGKVNNVLFRDGLESPPPAFDRRAACT